MQTAELDFTGDNALTGFRLQRMEVFNWGTFDRHIWLIKPGGSNSLLTGDIGSGKSTLVDAIITLLVPHNRIVYNKAAGALGKERSLYSYIRGEYKSEQDEFTQTAKAITLRDENNYSVLLAHFFNQGFDQGVTLAQVFWIKDGKTNPERLFVVAERPLAIAENFSRFGSDILNLKKRLQNTNRVRVFESFREYATRFRQLFGIEHEKALELFYQTVSMKSVGNLTDFVRNHMLEKSDVESRITELRRAFDNLNRAHEAVIKAKQQIERLEPLVADGMRYDELSRLIDKFTACRNALAAWFAEHKVQLLETQITHLEQEIADLDRRLERLGQELANILAKEDSLKAGIEDHGGSRLRAIDQEVRRLELERQRRQSAQQRYQACAQRLGLVAANNEHTFTDNQRQAGRQLKQFRRDGEQLDLDKTDRAVDLRALKQQGASLEAELESLRSRKSNIPLRNLTIRLEMAEDLDIAEENLPFVGELLQVDEQEAAWEGVIERLLHNFGLSLLVPEEHYVQISHYVDRTHLRGRLVYYRVREGEQKPQVTPHDPRSLMRKLRIRPDNRFYSWLETWLRNKFDYICCDQLDEFRRLPKAITRQGQIKTGSRRHEKDDRRSIHDRSHYVLGWTNEGKIQALKRQLKELSAKGQGLATELERMRKHQEVLSIARDSARDLLQYDDYLEIDWQALAREIQNLQDEKCRIEASSDRLKDLRAQLHRVQDELQKTRQKEQKLLEDKGALRNRRETHVNALPEARAQAADLNEATRQRLITTLEKFKAQTLNDKRLTLQNLDKSQTATREHIQGQLDNQQAKRSRVMQRLIQHMQRYKTDYPAETVEVDASIESLGEYSAMLQTLREEDLPRHEARFREMLREDTINSVAMFQGQLERQRQEIREKITTINASLREIEYSPGTYITLLAEKTTDLEIRDFRQELRQCLSHALSQDTLYSEEKFLQVKAIIERFNGREGLIDQDRRWTRKVTDVRNWFDFSASERWHEDEKEKEFYNDTSGKSGGQKEKLAYTILASALAYQFGLEWNQVRSRSFRFVVIDEAFGKGSDESTRYALELFRKLNLQLLIVTPLQKIRVIEDYINAVHFVHNEDGRNSIIRNLTVEEYEAEKQAFFSNPRHDHFREDPSPDFPP